LGLFPLVLETSPKRSAADLGRLFQDDEAGALKVTHNALRGDSGHVFVSAVDTLAAIEPKRKRDCIGKVVRTCECELVVNGHGRC
jgi:hypothetical protein